MVADTLSTQIDLQSILCRINNADFFLAQEQYAMPLNDSSDEVKAVPHSAPS